MRLDGVFGNDESCRELGPVKSEVGNMGRKCSGELERPECFGEVLGSISQTFETFVRWAANPLASLKEKTPDREGTLQYLAQDKGLSVNVPGHLDRGYREKE